MLLKKRVLVIFALIIIVQVKALITTRVEDFEEAEDLEHALAVLDSLEKAVNVTEEVSSQIENLVNQVLTAGEEVVKDSKHKYRLLLTKITNTMNKVREKAKRIDSVSKCILGISYGKDLFSYQIRSIERCVLKSVKTTETLARMYLFNVKFGFDKLQDVFDAISACFHSSQTEKTCLVETLMENETSIDCILENSEDIKERAIRHVLKATKAITNCADIQDLEAKHKQHKIFESAWKCIEDNIHKFKSIQNL